MRRDDKTRLFWSDDERDASRLLPPNVIPQVEKLAKESGSSNAQVLRAALKFYEAMLRDTRDPVARQADLDRGILHGDLKPGNVLIERPRPRKVSLSVASVLIPEKLVAEGLLVRSTSVMWRHLLDRLRKDWSLAYRLDPAQWEEVIAAAFTSEGFDEVVLTPRSHDKGRDVIAVKKGVGCVKVLGSMKAYAPGHLVSHDDVRALVGVLNLEPDASKGLLATTSDFAPGIGIDPDFRRLQPTRLELMNGMKLRQWLHRLSKK